MYLYTYIHCSKNVYAFAYFILVSDDVIDSAGVIDVGRYKTDYKLRFQVVITIYRLLYKFVTKTTITSYYNEENYNK